jgi:exopolyphosphatase/guanosine-5'-triphosphate,3'-diphosphate pyrophosphatase
VSTKAVIDIGTNSIKLLVMRQAGGSVSTAADRNEIARLGEGSAQSGRLSEEAMNRALIVIGDMVREAAEFGCDEIHAVATQAVRAAANCEEFRRLVSTSCGLNINVISGDEEANLSFHAVISAISRDVPRICAFDIGGGSSEIVTGDRSGSGPSYRRSVPIGALSLYNELFKGFDGPVEEDILKAASAKVRHELGDGNAWRAQNGLCFAGVGGTITTLAAVALAIDPYNAEVVSGTVLDVGEIDRQIGRFASTSTKERAKTPGLNPKRADIILPGACIVRELMNYTGAEELIVLDRGLRYGVMESYFGIK